MGQAWSVAPHLRLLGAQVAIGAAAIFARYALTGTGPLCASALRLAIAVIPVAAIVWVRGGMRWPGARIEAALAAAGFALAVHFAAWLASLEYTSVALSTLLVCTSPLWTELYEIVVRRRAIVWQYTVALALAAVGLALVLGRRHVAALIPGHAVAGALFALLGGAAIAAYLLIVTPRIGARISGNSEASPASTLRITDVILRTYAWAAVFLAVASALRHDAPPPLAATAAWLGIVAMGLVSQSIGHTGLNAALRDFPATTVAMSTLLEPVAAAVLAAILFRETLTPIALIGGACILIAIGFAAVSTAQKTSPLRGRVRTPRAAP